MKDYINDLFLQINLNIFRKGAKKKWASAHTSLGFFLHAPNLFVWLKEAPKLIFCKTPTLYFI